MKGKSSLTSSSHKHTGGQRETRQSCQRTNSDNMLPLRRLQHNRLLFVWMATSLAVLAVGCGGQEMPESTTIDETFSNGNNTDATTKNTNSMRIEDIFLWRKLGGERLGLDLLPDGLHQELLKLFMFPTGVTSSPNVSRQCVEDTVFYYNNLLTEGSDWATKSKSTINQRCTVFFFFKTCTVLYSTIQYDNSHNTFDNR